MKRGRFAPTPSGFLHIGNAMTALLAWLQIRQAGGQFVLRVEDIDRPRCRAEWAERQLADLRWLGLDWDEGPDVGGSFGPYLQSERTALYENAIERLLQSGRLYPCYCSRAELQAVASAPHGLSADGPAYPGTCRHLPETVRREKAASKTPSCRFALPDRPIAFVDGAAGLQTFPPGAGGDFVLRRADGIIGYQLAVVVDDAAMGITDVLRGWDLLDSTPRQLLLFEALGLPAPNYTHVPLLYGSDGRRLSKRHGAVHLPAVRDAGTAPERLIGWLLYWSGQLERPEPMKAAEAVSVFNPRRLPHGAVPVDDRALRILTGSV